MLNHSVGLYLNVKVMHGVQYAAQKMTGVVEMVFFVRCRFGVHLQTLVSMHGNWYKKLMAV